MKAIDNILIEDKKLIEDNIKSIYNNTEFEQMCGYAIASGGKRIRPILFLQSFKAFSKLDDHALQFATALELIHNYSLVHDDLPEMDNDVYRRGNLSVYGKYGQTNAVLVGDELLNNAFCIILNTLGKIKDLEYKNRAIKTASLILNSSGKSGMILGQFYDLKDEKKDLERIKFINDYKTGALFRASILGGAMLAGANENDLNQLEIYSNSIGMSFQLKDDLFDYEQDIKLNKDTVVTIIGKDATVKEIDRLNNIAKYSLKNIEGDISFFDNFVEFLDKRKF